MLARDEIDTAKKVLAYIKEHDNGTTTGEEIMNHFGISLEFYDMCLSLSLPMLTANSEAASWRNKYQRLRSAVLKSKPETRKLRDKLVAIIHEEEGAA